MGEISNPKKVLFVSVLIVMCVFGLPAQGKYGGGTGKLYNPYLIYNADQMNAIGADSNDWDKHFKLMADIDLSAFTGTEFNVIGRGRPIFPGYEPFTGTFDGNHHKISNFTYDNPVRSDTIGIFGSVDGESSEIKNLTLRAPHVRVGAESFYVGCLAGVFGSGSVYGCRVEGASVSGANFVGGLFGICRGTIADCYAEGNISGSGMNTGGLAGCNGSGVMTGCYSSGIVFGISLGVGGLVGANTGTISNCNSSALVSGSNGEVGGLVGTNSEGTITKCYATGSASGYSGIGGLVGNNMDGGTISECHATASATGTGWSVGGLVGIIQWDGTIANCYATGSVSGEAHKIGGLVGGIYIGMVTNCYSTGRVEGSSSLIGGLVGDNESGLIINSFWDIESSRQWVSDGGTGLPTTQMQTESTFTSAGWDFITRIWKMCDEPSYPSLWWEICPERPVYYVDADAHGANNGSSWANAYNHLQDTLAVARYGDEILVAQGVYKPIRYVPPPPPPPPPPPMGSSNGQDTGVMALDRTATFQLKNGVVINGGYAGFGEPDPDARDIRLYETILSGDLKGNDIDVNAPPQSYNDPCRAENSYHVLTGSGCDESAVLDGFTITGGNANRYEEETDSGGGMYNKYGSPTLINCTFTCNSAGNDGLGGGGGMYNYHSSPKLTNCIFNNNSAVYDCAGGGMYNYYSDPTFSNCTFRGNTAEYCGGGMYNNWSNPTVINCTFADNFAPFRGGGIHNDYGSFRPTFTNCTFISNHSDVDGGAIYNFSHCSPTITKCTFSNNSAGENGGGIANCYGNSPKLKNCLFTGNSAGQDGGGIYNYGYYASEVTTVTNSTFIGNFALNGNALAFDSFYQEYPSSHEISNCILYDGDDIIWNNDGSTINISYTNLQGGTAACYDPCGTIVWVLGNIDSKPHFVNAPKGDYHLKSKAGGWDPVSQTWVNHGNTSACIDAGDPNSDWRGELWPHGERINMGAYGGTAEASMSLSDAGNIADLNFDGLLCYRDMKLLTDKWLCEAILLPEDLSRDGIVNFTDFAFFVHYWELPARNPNPADEATGVSINAELSWTAGRGATSHDVYFGTSSPPPFVCNQTDTTFDPGTMDYDTMYYWRIDEVNTGGKTTGQVWSFTTFGAPPPPPPPP